MGNTSATRIGNRIGLAAKERPKPKPREICPRFQPSLPITHYTNSIRSKNTTPRNLGTDKTKITSTKKTNTIPLAHSNVRNSQSAKSATSTNKIVLNSARNRPQTAKPNEKPKPTAV